MPLVMKDIPVTFTLRFAGAWLEPATQALHPRGQTLAVVAQLVDRGEEGVGFVVAG